MTFVLAVLLFFRGVSCFVVTAHFFYFWAGFVRVSPVLRRISRVFVGVREYSWVVS